MRNLSCSRRENFPAGSSPAHRLPPTTPDKTKLPLTNALLASLRQMCQNQLPLFKRKRLELQGELKKRDLKIAFLKKEPLFTKIVELEAILTCYQTELQRLGALQEGCETAQREEAQALQQFIKEKTSVLEDLTKQKVEVEKNCAEMKGSLEHFEREYGDVERRLKEKHGEVRTVYERFKMLLAEVTKKEQMKIDFSIIGERNNLVSAEIDRLRAQAERYGKMNNCIRRSIFQKKLSEEVADLLYRARRRTHTCAREGTKGSILDLFEAEQVDGGFVNARTVYRIFEEYGVRMSRTEFDPLVALFDDPERIPFREIVVLMAAQSGTAGAPEEEVKWRFGFQLHIDIYLFPTILQNIIPLSSSLASRTRT